MREEQLFHQVLEQAADRRAAFLEAACGGDAELRHRVEVLLRAQANPGSFLLSPAHGVGHSPTHDHPPAERPGTQIGPYKLLQQIGEGGMGIVYMAEQIEPVQRKVALKVIKPGMDSRQVIARFEAERQALAMMDHVNIARVLDAGLQQGRPYFVMELVHGVPITKYCDDNRLTPRQRLELFVPVCQAIQHAHQKGIIHRDIKPSNVMVTLYDGKPVPKVIDFGVAKATEQKLTERTLFTQYGTMVGTLEYMSPEQAEMSALGVDTRSDIYSLGVLLYELLTGSTPLSSKRMKEATYAEILRLIKEEEPLKPSTRLSDSGEALGSISAQRQTEPAKLAKLVRGELDWIVIKSLEKDRNRRYETASAFAADVQRYLNDEPVQACPPSVNYRLRKLVRRHRGPVLAASLVVLALVGGIIGTTWGMLRATDAEVVAVNEANQKAEALTDKEVALADAKEQLFLALVTRARAERSSGRIGQRFEALKAIRAAARIHITPELRTEAMAALVLPDAEVAQEWELSTEDRFNMAFDASFQRYARQEREGGVTVCRLSNGQEEVITRLPVPGKPPYYGFSMSQDGRFVAVQHSRASLMQVWKLDGSEPALLLDELPGFHESAFAFHPSGRQLAIGHADKSVSVYDLATGRRVQRLAVSTAPFHLAFHPREHRLAVASGNGVQLFDTDTGKELPALRHSAEVTQTWFLTWHPDGRRLAVSGDDRKIHLWDTQTATEVMSPWTGHTADGLVVAFNHAGDRLASVDWSSQTRLWDAVAGRTLLTMPDVGLQFSSDDRLFGPESSGNKIRLWRLAGGRELRVLRPGNAGSLDNIVSPVVHADGRTLAAAARQHLCFFDLASGEELASVRLPLPHAARPVFFDPPHSPQGSPDSKSGLPEDRSGGWMTGGQSGLCFWPARQDSARPEVMRIGPPQQIAPNPGGGYSNGASASAGGRVVAVPQGNSTLVLYRDRPDRRVVLGPQYDVRLSSVSPNGRWVVTCSWGWDGHSKTIRIWDADTGLPVQDLAQEGYTSAKFSPDGRWLMTAGASGSRQWEVGAWREVRHFDQGKFVFSPDSRLLAINDVLGVIRLLETTTGREVARLTGPEPTWYAPACFTPDGTLLVATCSAETALYVWDLALIRQQLQELGLDWDWPDFPLAAPSNHAAKPLQVEVLLGDLAKPPLTREQKARQDIERCRLAIAANPDDALACNDLAWLYVTAPESLRDLKAALPLAEKALRLKEKNAIYRNTLGVAYYRAGRYREAVETLRPNLRIQQEWALAFDLYFLAMSHHHLGEAALARDYYDLAVRWTRPQPGLSAEGLEELTVFRAEAEELLKQESVRRECCFSGVADRAD
jgi:eukaryotic-like serine/threonine-protein kinase